MLSRICLAATAGTSLVRDSRIIEQGLSYRKVHACMLTHSLYHHEGAGSSLSLTKIPHCCLRRIYTIQVAGRSLKPARGMEKLLVLS